MTAFAVKKRYNGREMKIKHFYTKIILKKNELYLYIKKTGLTGARPVQLKLKELMLV